MLGVGLLMKYLIGAASLLGVVSTSAGAQEDALRFHPVEAYCIDYDMVRGGDDNAWRKVCSRNYGAETYSIEYYETVGGKLGGEKRIDVCYRHHIETGDKAYTFDLGSGEGHLYTNHAYPVHVAAAKALADEGTRDAHIGAYGFTPTGETKQILDQTCDVYEQGKVSACYTDDALMIEFVQPNPFGMRLTATRVDIGEGGDDKNYRLFEIRPFKKIPPNGFQISKCTPKDEMVQDKAQ